MLIVFRSRMVLFVFLFVVVFFAVNANATSITYSTTPIEDSGTSSGTFDLPQYSGPGVLVSVTLQLTGYSYGGYLSVENKSSKTNDVTLVLGANYSVTGPSSLSSGITPMLALSTTLPKYDGVSDYAGVDSVTLDGTSSTDSNSMTLTTNLSPYVGSGKVTFNYTTKSIAIVSSVEGFRGDSDPTSYRFNASVVYDVVPEPGTLTLLALGGVALVHRGRRRR